MYPTVKKTKDIEQAMKRLLEKGSALYYITDKAMPVSKHLSYETVLIQNWQSSSLERPFNALPESIESFRQSAKIYRVTLLKPHHFLPKRREGGYRIDIGPNCFGLLSGFDRSRSFSVPSDDATLWRWSQGTSSIRFTNDTLPAKILLYVQSKRPETVDRAEVVAFLNDVSLGTKSIDRNAAFHTIEFPVPEDIQPDKENAYTLTLRSTTWVPKEEGISDDRRILGFQLSKITLENGSVRTIDAAGEYHVSFSGFYAIEADRFSQEECRWTGAKARLVIPWFGNDQPHTIRLRAAGFRPGNVPKARIVLSIDGQEIGEQELNDEMTTYSFKVTPGQITTRMGNRAVLLIKTKNLWTPAHYGIKGYPQVLGILLDWVEIE